ncbi:MAG: hypothetical protein JNN00_04415 [Chitinophagaceae bacterium]|nr:hypothetical protein [Chitinophagaceae bacterium]
MDKAKIRLSPKEAGLVSNADWILTKNSILQKVKYLLEHLQADQQEIMNNYSPALPAEVIKVSPKISKGENYRGLPYLVLDHPRYFEKDDHFAIRSMFWWGNFFSITLHLSGIYKNKYEQILCECFDDLQRENYSICSNADKWEHHFEAGNYASLQEMNRQIFSHTIRQKDFLKLAKTYPLQEWDNAGNEMLASFDRLLKWLVRQRPSG